MMRDNVHINGVRSHVICDGCLHIIICFAEASDALSVIVFWDDGSV